MNETNEMKEQGCKRFFLLSIYVSFVNAVWRESESVRMSTNSVELFAHSGNFQHEYAGDCLSFIVVISMRLHAPITNETKTMFYWHISPYQHINYQIMPVVDLCCFVYFIQIADTNTNIHHLAIN